MRMNYQVLTAMVGLRFLFIASNRRSQNSSRLSNTVLRNHSNHFTNYVQYLIAYVEVIETYR